PPTFLLLLHGSGGDCTGNSHLRFLLLSGSEQKRASSHSTRILLRRCTHSSRFILARHSDCNRYCWYDKESNHNN
ncbi:hypothetical protein PENTCL1PPCAC_22309, partial [Pristionchus entomophagus]